MIIEGKVRALLADKMGGIAVYMEVPAEVPEQYITVQLTAGSARDHVRQGSVAVRCISRKSKLGAAQMCEDAIDVLCTHLPSYAGIAACRVNSHYDNTLVSTKEYCYQAVFNIFYMED